MPMLATVGIEADARSNLLYQHSCRYHYDELPATERIIVYVSYWSNNGG